MSSLASILAKTPATTIEDVVIRLNEIQAALPESDGVACFNRFYSTVTLKVNEVKDQGKFLNKVFLSTLVVTFANLYFQTLGQVEKGASPPRAWGPLLDARSRNGIAPLQFALAGMNAHINRDLPVALVQTFSQLGITMTRPSPEANDYNTVNEVLAEVEALIAETYFTPLLKQLHPDLAGADDAVANWSVKEARASAWTNGATLWHLRNLSTMVTEYLESLDGLVGIAGRGLLICKVK